MPEANNKNEKKNDDCRPPKYWFKHHHIHNGDMGAFYCLGIIGVAVYNVQQVSGFWPDVLAVIKAFFWPAYLLYEVFTLLKM